jgi:hypothetical protein
VNALTCYNSGEIEQAGIYQGFKDIAAVKKQCSVLREV